MCEVEGGDTSRRVQMRIRTILVSPYRPESCILPPMATKRSVLWSKEMFSPLDMKEKFNERFPVIVMVARGYYGQTEIDTLGSDQVLIIQGWSSQSRVVARDNRRRSISIPLDYPLKFEVASQSGAEKPKAQWLWEILETHKLPVRVNFDQQVSSCFYVGANPRCTETFGELELTAVYQENYLKGNTINAGKIDVEAITVVPMYMKTHFVIAEGLKGAPPNLWENMRHHYISRVQHLDFDNVTGNQDIMLYDACNESQTQYDLVMPKSYVRHPSIQCQGEKPGFSSQGTIKPTPKLQRIETKYYPLKARSSSNSESGNVDHSYRFVNQDTLYTGLTHSVQCRQQQAVSAQHTTGQPSRAPGANHNVHYRERYNGTASGEGILTSPRRCPAAAALTTQNQGELLRQLQSLSVTRQTRLSDSSTDSSSNSGRSSPAKHMSPHRSGCPASPSRHCPMARHQRLSESDSGKGSQYAAEDMISSDDSDDVFLNNDESLRSCPMFPRIVEVRRNRSESDAPRHIYEVYGTRNTHSTSSITRGSPAIDNVSYYTVARFRTLEDVPQDVSVLNVDEVALCLRMLNLYMHVPKFLEYHVDGDLLLAFSYEDFHRQFGMDINKAKMLERFARHGWRPRVIPNPCSRHPVKLKK